MNDETIAVAEAAQQKLADVCRALETLEELLGQAADDIPPRNMAATLRLLRLGVENGATF